MKRDALVYAGNATKIFGPSAKLLPFMREMIRPAVFLTNENANFYSMEELENIDTVFFQNSPSALFCTCRDKIVHLMKHCRRLVWMQNDYTRQPMTQVRRVIESRKPAIELEIWSNIPEYPHAFRIMRAWSLFPQPKYINWNKMQYNNKMQYDWIPQHSRENVIPGLLYYGTFREDREMYFRRYFGVNTNSLYQGHVSSTESGVGEFGAMNSKLNFNLKFKNLADIWRYQASIYLEDKFTHTCYNSPANRFYECLGYGVPMLFDVSCRPTFDKAGYDVNFFLVCDAEGVYRRLPDSEEIRERQSAWCRDYVSELRAEFAKLLEGDCEKI